MSADKLVAAPGHPHFSDSDRRLSSSAMQEAPPGQLPLLHHPAITTMYNHARELANLPNEYRYKEGVCVAAVATRWS